MANVYLSMDETSLRTLRSIKLIRQKKLEGVQRGWFQEQELRKLHRQIEEIDIVLRMKEEQERLF